MIQVENASKLHIPDIERLYIQLFDVLAKLQPQNFKPAPQDRSFIESAIDGIDSTIFIAKEDSFVVGVLLIKEQSTPPYNCLIQRRTAYIMDVVVDINHRGKGIGKQLMQEAENWATSRNIDYIELAVLNENTSAKGLYEELGFTYSFHTMAKILK